MENRTKWCFIFGLALLALIFSVAAVFTPWWRVTTAREKEVTNGISMDAEYGLFQIVNARKITGLENETLLITVSFANLTGDEADKTALSSLFSASFNLTLAGLAFAAVTTALILVAGFRKPLINYAKFSGIVAAILLIVTSIYFAAELPSIVSKLDSVIPTEVYWLHGKGISGFWGGIEMPSGLQEWVWSSGFGWYLSFTACLLNIAVSMLIHVLYSKIGG